MPASHMFEFWQYGYSLAISVRKTDMVTAQSYPYGKPAWLRPRRINTDIPYVYGTAVSIWTLGCPRLMLRILIYAYAVFRMRLSPRDLGASSTKQTSRDGQVKGLFQERI